MINDHLSNAIVVYKNAYLVQKENFEVYYTNEVYNFFKILEDLSFLKEVKKFKLKDSSISKLTANLSDKIPFDIKRVSKPGNRVYFSIQDLQNNNSRNALYIISTSKGYKNSKQALKEKTGGEVICKILLQ